jgi:hypothetical protein
LRSVGHHRGPQDATLHDRDLERPLMNFGQRVPTGTCSQAPGTGERGAAAGHRPAVRAVLRRPTAPRARRLSGLAPGQRDGGLRQQADGGSRVGSRGTTRILAEGCGPLGNSWPGLPVPQQFQPGHLVVLETPGRCGPRPFPLRPRDLSQPPARSAGPAGLLLGHLHARRCKSCWFGCGRDCAGITSVSTAAPLPQPSSAGLDADGARALRVRPVVSSG